MKNLSQAAALAAYRRIAAALGAETHPLPVWQGIGPWPTDRPVLVNDYDEGPRWAVVWEQGPDEWVRFEAVRAAAPAGVFVEPVNMIALALYPA